MSGLLFIIIAMHFIQEELLLISPHRNDIKDLYQYEDMKPYSNDLDPFVFWDCKNISWSCNQHTVVKDSVAITVKINPTKGFHDADEQD